MTDEPADRSKVAEILLLADKLWARGDAAWDRRHLDEAEDLLRRAAQMGSVSAMNSLATLLDDDLGRKDEAVIWYEKAVAAGDAQAAWNLAMHYVPLSDRRLYRHWMCRAAEMGEEDAAAEVAKFESDPDYMTKLPLEESE